MHFLFSVMLVHDKLSHLALSVPDISSHCFQQQQNQYNAVQHQAPIMGSWSTASVPSHTVVQVIPGGTASKKLDTTAMNGSAVVPVSLNNGVGPHHHHHHSDGNATNSSGDPQNTGLMLPNHSKANGGWFNGLLGCLRPVWTIIGKATAHDLKHHHGNQSSKFCSKFFTPFFSFILHKGQQSLGKVDKKLGLCKQKVVVVAKLSLPTVPTNSQYKFP